MQQASQSKQLFYGTSAERANLARQPSSLNPGDVFTEVGGSVFEWDGTSWIQISTNGGAHVHEKATDVPKAQEQEIKGTAIVAASGVDNTIIYTASGLIGFSYHSFENLAATDPVDIFGSLDGTNFNASPLAVRLADDLTTGGGVNVIDIPAGKIGTVIGKWKALKVQKKGTTNEIDSVRYLHGVS